MTQSITQAVSQTLSQLDESPKPATVNYALLNMDPDYRKPQGVWFGAEMSEARDEEEDWRKSGFNVRILERKNGFIEGEANHSIDILGGDIIYKPFDNDKEDVGIMLKSYHVGVMLSIQDLGLRFENQENCVEAYFS
jgi:hypothetical protein